MKKLLILSMAALLSACGGGGQDSATQPDDNQDPAEISSVTEMKVSEEVNFEASSSHNISVNLADSFASATFLICGQTSAEGASEANKYNINFGDCILSTKLDANGDYSSDFEALKTVTTFVAAAIPSGDVSGAQYQSFTGALAWSAE